MQSNNVLGVERAGTTWQIVLVTTADHKYARRPEIMQTTFAQYISGFLSRRILTTFLH